MARFERPYELWSDLKFAGLFGLSCLFAIVLGVSIVSNPSWASWSSVLVVGFLLFTTWRRLRMGVHVNDDAVRVTGFLPGPRRTRTLSWSEVAAVESRPHPDAVGTVAGAEGIHLVLTDGTVLPTPLVREPTGVNQRDSGSRSSGDPWLSPLMWLDEREYGITLARIREWYDWGAYQATLPKPAAAPVHPVQEVKRFRRARR